MDFQGCNFDKKSFFITVNNRIYKNFHISISNEQIK